MIRVRAANGESSCRSGPSFGEWLPYDQIPPIMRDAMISVEDRRFRTHIGVDPIGIVRALGVGVTSGPPGAGRLDHHPAARPQHLPDQQPHLRPQDQGGDPGAGARAQFSKDQILELYLNRVYFGGGAYGIDAASRRFFGHSATSSEPRRSGDHRRPGQGAVQLFADRRRRGGARAPGVVLRRWSRTASSPPPRPPRVHPANVRSSRPPTRTASAISPTGCCRSSTR